MSPGFARFARFALVYTVAVILFGAWVRISGSGAGCGQHWPTCHGEIVHLPQSIETATELTHRATSGLAMIVALVLCGWGLAKFPRGHVARLGAVLSLVFMITEALVGARLVLLGLVGSDASIPRAVIMPIHLTNTFLLTAAMALAVWGSTYPERRTLKLAAAKGKLMLLGTAMAVMLLVSTTGAVTALGDTLFPVHGAALDVGAHVAHDQRVDANTIERLRWIHPVLAMAGAFFLMHAGGFLGRKDERPAVRAAGRRVVALVVAQVLAGVVNIVLSAPGWMQIIHLGLATATWIALIWLGSWVTSPEPGSKAA